VLSIAQITDLHVTTRDDPLNQARNEYRLRTVLRSVHALKPRPAVIIASGDLVDRGQPGEYEELKQILKDCEIPIWFAMGNHDNRDAFVAAFSSGYHLDPNGYVQYALDLDGLRVVVCDTLEHGKDRSGFCERRAQWLSDTLDADRETPTVVFMHHPPILSGVHWMDPEPDAPWILQTAKAIEGRENLAAVLCGHVHRGFQGMLAGKLVTTTPASSIQVTLDLRDIDMDRPDGREILVAEPPAYALVVVDGGRVTTHSGVAGDFEPAVAFTRPLKLA
jgi:3',5'-cyclic AMP phosphodiesterase CpdA